MTEQILQAKKDFSRMGMALFAIAGITAVLQLAISMALMLLLPDLKPDNSQWVLWLLTFAPMYLIAVPIGLSMIRKIPTDIQPATKLTGKQFFRYLLMCMPIMYGGNLLGNYLSSLLSGGTAENALQTYVSGNPLYTIVFAVIIAPLLEEYIFRKQIIDRLGKYGEKTAILISALTFGLFHMNLFQFFYAFGLGLLFAYIYTRTRMLRYCVMLHMLINFQGSVLAPSILSLMDMDTLASLENGIMPENATPFFLLMAYTFGLLLAVVIGFVLLLDSRRRFELFPTDQELPGYYAGSIPYRNCGMILFTGFCLIMMVLSLVS